MEGRHAVAATDGGPRRPWLRRRGRRADAMIFAHAPLFERIKGIKFGVEREEELFFDPLSHIITMSNILCKIDPHKYS